MSESKKPTLRELFGAVPDLIPNPVSSEAWVRRFRDGYDAGYEAGRAEERARCIAVVEGAERHEPCEEPTFGGTYPAMRPTRRKRGKKAVEGDGEWVERSTVLASLTGADK